MGRSSCVVFPFFGRCSLPAVAELNKKRLALNQVGVRKRGESIHPQCGTSGCTKHEIQGTPDLGPNFLFGWASPAQGVKKFRTFGHENWNGACFGTTVFGGFGQVWEVWAVFPVPFLGPKEIENEGLFS